MLKDTLYRKSRLDLQKYGLRQWIHDLAKQQACIYLELSLSYKTKQKCSFVHILFQLINLTNQKMAYQLLSNSNFIGWKSINTSVHVIIQTTHPQDIMTQNCIHVHNFIRKT